LHVIVSVFVKRTSSPLHSALCPLRNLEAANRVGRPCRKNCAKHDNTPFQRKCKGDRYCECDHECGYSCIKQGKHTL